MKTRLLPTIIAAVLACAAAVQAQPAKPLSIATVNVGKVFDKYYKREAVETAIKEFVQGLDKQRQDLGASAQKAQTEYRDLLDKSNDQASSAGERDKNKLAAEAKLKELKDLDQTFQEFTAAANTKIDEKKRQFTEKLLGEIKDAVAAKAKAAGFSLVLDSGVVVLYSNGDNDLTAAVLDQLNAAAPVLSPTFKPSPKP